MTPMPLADVFQVERNTDTVILIPAVNLSELEYDEAAMQQVYILFNDESIKNLIIDFHRCDYFGSTALGFFVRLWKKIQERKGRMCFCNLSEHESEILRITRLDELWEVRTTRDEAVKAIRNGTSKDAG
jgi:anti-anti-sigma factor